MSELALDQDDLLYKLIAGKVKNGYQIEIVMVSGNSYFGFLSGLDRDMVQIFTTEVDAPRGNHKHPYNHYSLVEKNGTKEFGYYIWIPITNIEAAIENRLSLKNFTDAAKKTIRGKQNNFSKVVLAWLRDNERKN